MGKDRNQLEGITTPNPNQMLATWGPQAKAMEKLIPPGVSILQIKCLRPEDRKQRERKN